jgi:hypothetical protein
MLRLDAHALFAAMQDRGDVSRWPLELRDQEQGPAGMVALAALSGLLDDAETEADLLAAAEHGASLLDGNVLPVARWAAEIERTLGDVLRWGDEIERTLNQAAANN